MASRGKRRQKRRNAARRTGQAQTPARRQPQSPDPLSLDPASVVQQTVQAMTITSAWQGPIPPPSDLEHYEHVEKGLASRIVVMAERAVDMAERQMEHRIEMEKRMVVGHNRRANTGLWMALLLALAVLGGAFYSINNGYPVAGATIASIDLIGLCGVFIYGRYDQNRREQERTQR